MRHISKKVLVLLILAVFGIVGLTVWSSVQSKNTEQVFIENKTRSLIVESVKESGAKKDKNTTEISLRNNYDKSIAAYRVRVSENFNGKTEESAVERGGLIVGWVLGPNEIKVEKFFTNPEAKTHLVIAAVLFEDGTGDGEIAELTRLQNIRAGVLLGFQKIVPILQNAVKMNESLSSDTAIQSLTEKIKQLDDEDIPDNSKRGFALAKSYMSIELKDLKDKKSLDSAFSPDTKLATKLSEIELVLTKYPVNLPSKTVEIRRQNEN